MAHRRRRRGHADRRRCHRRRRRGRGRAPNPATAPTDPSPRPPTCSVRRSPRFRTSCGHAGRRRRLGPLGLAYVQQAKDTVNPQYYPKADGALATLDAPAAHRTTSRAGRHAEPAAAQHRFPDALDLARQAQADRAPELHDLRRPGRRLDPARPLRRGARGRAAHGRPAARHARAHPRAEYVFELAGRGRPGRATCMQRGAGRRHLARRAARSAHYYLAELAFSGGDARQALADPAGLPPTPATPICWRARRRRRRRSAGSRRRRATAARSSRRVPQPQYVVEAGEFCESTGRTAQAQEDYSLFAAENALFTATASQLDTDPTLFYADHGDPAKRAACPARRVSRCGRSWRWTTPTPGRCTPTTVTPRRSTWSDKARATGMRNALFAFHRGMIEKVAGAHARGPPPTSPRRWRSTPLQPAAGAGRPRDARRAGWPAVSPDPARGSRPDGGGGIVVAGSLQPARRPRPRAGGRCSSAPRRPTPFRWATPPSTTTTG